MRKNMFKLVSSLIVIMVFLFGCANGTDTNPENEATENQSASEENQEESIHITISEEEDDEVIVEKDIDVEDGAILMDVLKENFDVEEEGGFIHSIEGIAPEEDEERAWMYYVNDEYAEVGANEYEISPGDDVVFDLQAWD